MITAIGVVVPRHRTTVAGEVMSVTSYQRPWVRTDVEVSDGTGVLLLRFVGRSSLPGMEEGRCLEVAGTPAWDGGVLVMLNPRYAFVTNG
jgi:hypothetical protein